MDWKLFEDALHDAALTALRTVLSAHPEQRFYAAALSGSYREEDGPIYLPVLSLNSEEAFAADHPDSDVTGLWSTRWNPPDWRWNEIEAFRTPEVLAYEAALTVEARKGTTAHWRRTEARALSSIVKVCKSLRRSLHADTACAPALTRDFVVLPLEEGAEGEALVRRCVSERELFSLFPHLNLAQLEAQRVAALPIDAQVTHHVLRLQRPDLASPNAEDADNALRRIGAPAHAALMALLADEAHGWHAAMLLANIGLPTPAVIAALRARLDRPVRRQDHRGQANRAWCARALCFLGDDAHLLARLATTANILPEDTWIIDGLCAPYSAFRDRSAHPRALDYAPLERLLDSRPGAAAVVANELQPGSSYCTLQPAEIGEALRGLQSPHAAIRIHATSVLGERSPGTTAGKRAVPALATALDDADRTVRYIAMLGLIAWKQPAEHYRAQIEALIQDGAEATRQVAQQWLTASDLQTHASLELENADDVQRAVKVMQRQA